jgi:hypothetical protein
MRTTQFEYGHKFLTSPAAIARAEGDKHRLWLWVPTPEGTHIFESFNEGAKWNRARLNALAAKRAAVKAKAAAKAKAERAKKKAVAKAPGRKAVARKAVKAAPKVAHSRKAPVALTAKRLVAQSKKAKR